MGQSTWNGPAGSPPLEPAAPIGLEINRVDVHHRRLVDRHAGHAPRLEISRADRVGDLAVRLLGNPLVDFAACLRPVPELGGTKRRGKALFHLVVIVLPKLGVGRIHPHRVGHRDFGPPVFCRRLKFPAKVRQVPDQLLIIVGEVQHAGKLLASLAAAGHVTDRQSVENTLRRQDHVLLGRVALGVTFQQVQGKRVDALAEFRILTFAPGAGRNPSEDHGQHARQRHLQRFAEKQHFGPPCAFSSISAQLGYRATGGIGKRQNARAHTALDAPGDEIIPVALRSGGWARGKPPLAGQTVMTAVSGGLVGVTEGEIAVVMGS